MSGSGEGTSEEMPPWEGESEPPASTSDDQVSMSLPVGKAVAEPQPQLEPIVAPLPKVSVKPEAKSSSAAGKVLLVLVVLALVGAGAYAAWHFYQESLKVDGDVTDPGKGEPVLDPTKPGDVKPPVDPKLGTVEDPGKKPSDTKPGDKKPGDKKPGDKKPGDKKPGDKKPGDKKPGDKKPGAGVKKPGSDGTKPPIKVNKRKRELAVQHAKSGNQLIRKKKFKEAINFFRKALKADRTLAQAHRGLGICYAQLGNNKTACREYRLYMKALKPDSKELPTLRKIVEGCK